MIPVFYINLDKDIERNDLIKPCLTKIFGEQFVHRVSGKKHSSPMEGCRLAHINAHQKALSMNYPYYIICEDDIKPLLSNNIISKYINNLTNMDLDLVLLEYGQNLEKFVKLKKTTYPHLYRTLGAKKYNSAGCYLCSKKMGKKLISLWLDNIGQHIDQLWVKLWKYNKVYFHRPQLFNQREGPSHMVGFRPEMKPFDWDKWETIN